MNKMKYVLGSAALFLLPAVAFADDGAAGGAYTSLAKGLAVGLAALGGAFGQGKIVAAAADAIGRNPGARDQVFTPMILGIAFVETLLLLTLFAARFAI